MELEIVKAEDGLCEGKVLYHAFESRTAEEIAVADAAKDEATKAEDARALRKQQQVKASSHPHCRAPVVLPNRHEAAVRSRQCGPKGL